jgi:hypothetical protein
VVEGVDSPCAAETSSRVPDVTPTIRAFVERLANGGSFSWHDDPRTSEDSHHYSLSGRGGALFLSYRVECHDVMNPIDTSQDFDDKPVTIDQAVSMLKYQGVHVT